MVSVDVKHHVYLLIHLKAQELCENRGGRPGLPVPNKPCGFCGCEAVKLSHFSLPVSGTDLPLTASTTSLGTFFFILASYYLSTKQSGDHYAALMLRGGSLGMGSSVALLPVGLAQWQSTKTTTTTTEKQKAMMSEGRSGENVECFNYFRMSSLHALFFTATVAF